MGVKKYNLEPFKVKMLIHKYLLHVKLIFNNYFLLHETWKSI